MPTAPALDSAPPPLQFAAWLACAAFSLWFFLLVDKTIQRVRGKEPQPPNGQLESDQKDLKRRVKNLEDWRDNILAKLESDKREIIAAGEKRESKLSAEITAAGDRIDALQAAVAGIPGEIMALLANARNLLGTNGEK
jgi:hypothetical protein